MYLPQNTMKKNKVILLIVRFAFCPKAAALSVSSSMVNDMTLLKALASSLGQNFRDGTYMYKKYRALLCCLPSKSENHLGVSSYSR
jgi:hypothetical protein